MDVVPKVQNISPGSHLIYGGHDLFSLITSIKTFGPGVHVEEYVGNGNSVASRNGIGVNLYPFREAGLIAVLEPKVTIDIQKGMRWFYEPYNKQTHAGVRGRYYGWWDLARFYNIVVPTDGWICSQFVSLFDNACGFYPFADAYNAGSIDPNDYFISPSFTLKWVDKKALKKILKF